MKNILINGNMNISQRGTTFTNPSPITGQTKPYTLDRFAFLSETNNGVVTQTSGGPTGSKYYMAVKNNAANVQTAMVQFVENQNAIALIGGIASLSFQAKAGVVPISNLRAALLGWTGTADATVSETVISSWGANGTNPTWGTSFVMLNVPTNLALSGAWQTFKVENIAIPSNVNNLAVVIWTDDGTQASGAEWDMAQVQLEYGSAATSFETRLVGMELQLCQRYYQQVNAATMSGVQIGTGNFEMAFAFQVPMRIAPPSAGSTNPTVINSAPALNVISGLSVTLTSPISFTYNGGTPSTTGVTFNCSLATNAWTGFANGWAVVFNTDIVLLGYSSEL